MSKISSRSLPILAAQAALVSLAAVASGFTAGAIAPAPAGLAPTAAAEDAASRARAEIEALLASQAEAWNRGDLVAFTAVYAEDATFLAPSGLTRGRDEVLARYRKRYPDRNAMGKLSFEVLETRPLGDEGPPDSLAAVSVAARWRLAYPAGGRPPAEGLTLLVLRRTAGRWQIVQDASM